MRLSRAKKLQKVSRTRRGEMRIFGAALDIPNSPERLNLKLGYVSHLMDTPNAAQSCTDPYDAIKADLKSGPRFFAEDLWMGKMPIDSWLTPRPWRICLSMTLSMESSTARSQLKDILS